MRASKSSSRAGLAKVMVFETGFLNLIFQPFALEIIAKNNKEGKAAGGFGFLISVFYYFNGVNFAIFPPRPALQAKVFSLAKPST